MSVFYPSDPYRQSKQLIYSSIPNFLIDLAKIINEYFIVELRVGTKLDCKDENGMWCIAQVTKVEQEEDRQSKFYVHYCGWREVYDDWIAMQSVCWRFDLLNAHTPVDEDSLIDINYRSLYFKPEALFYRECPSVAQRKTLVRRISGMGFPADAVTREYERFQWNRSPFAVFSALCSKFPKVFRCYCAPKKPICAFCCASSKNAALARQTMLH